MSDNVSIVEQLEAVTNAFIAQLPLRADEIERQWFQVKREPANPQRWQDLYRLAHNLAGGGGTFGFSEITDAARIAADLLRTAHADCQQLTVPVEIEPLEQALRRLQELCRDPGGKGEARQHIAPPQLLMEASLSRLVYLYAASPDRYAPLIKNLQAMGVRVESFQQEDALKEAILETSPLFILVDIAQCDAMAFLVDQPHPPIIAVTGAEDFSARLKAVRSGMDGFFVEPVDGASLLNYVDALLPQEWGMPFRVLIVDDDRSQAEYAALVLERAGMITCVVSDPSEIVDKLAAFTPELLLFDIYMPQCSGIELAQLVRQMSQYVSVPIIFLSAEDRRDRQLAALQVGADDFLTKPINAKELISAVNLRVWRARMINWVMLRDGLTGLLNHAVIMERLDNAVAMAQRQKGSLSIAMIDLDHFKLVNDKYGHPAGDRVLSVCSRVMQQRLRSSDAVGRYGGEEFMAILPDTSQQQAWAVIDEIRVAFGALKHAANGETFSVRMSAGIASYPDFASPRLLLEAADAALYRAKREGRDRVVMARQTD